MKEQCDKCKSRRASQGQSIRSNAEKDPYRSSKNTGRRSGSLCVHAQGYSFSRKVYVSPQNLTR